MAPKPSKYSPLADCLTLPRQHHKFQADTSTLEALMKGLRVGYVRVSSLEQNVERQLDGIALDRIFTDRTSGKASAASCAPACDVMRPPRVRHRLFGLRVQRALQHHRELGTREVSTPHRQAMTPTAVPLVRCREDCLEASLSGGRHTPQRQLAWRTHAAHIRRSTHSCSCRG